MQTLQVPRLLNTVVEQTPLQQMRMRKPSHVVLSL